MLDDVSRLRHATGTESPRLRLPKPIDPRREMEAFASAIAHDLRTPMNTSRRLLELVVGLHGSDLPPGPRTTLREVAQTLRGLEDLLEGLLRLGGVGHRRLEITAVDMASTVAEIVEQLRRRPTCAEVVFEVGDLPMCWGDRELVRELVLNLLDNACKYTRGQPERRVRVSAVAERGGIVYAVQDNGPGIAVGEATRVFEPFERDPPADDPGGSGLGLAIVQRIVQRHHGAVALVQGSGAEVRFRLPGEPWTDHGPAMGA